MNIGQETNNIKKEVVDIREVGGGKDVIIDGTYIPNISIDMGLNNSDNHNRCCNNKGIDCDRKKRYYFFHESVKYGMDINSKRLAVIMINFTYFSLVNASNVLFVSDYWVHWGGSPSNQSKETSFQDFF